MKGGGGFVELFSAMQAIAGYARALPNWKCSEFVVRRFEFALSVTVCGVAVVEGRHRVIALMQERYHPPSLHSEGYPLTGSGVPEGYHPLCGKHSRLC